MDSPLPQLKDTALRKLLSQTEDDLHVGARVVKCQELPGMFVATQVYEKKILVKIGVFDKLEQARAGIHTVYAEDNGLLARGKEGVKIHFGEKREKVKAQHKAELEEARGSAAAAAEGPALSAHELTSKMATMTLCAAAALEKALAAIDAQEMAFMRRLEETYEPEPAPIKTELEIRKDTIWAEMFVRRPNPYSVNTTAVGKDKVKVLGQACGGSSSGTAMQVDSCQQQDVDSDSSDDGHGDGGGFD